MAINNFQLNGIPAMRARIRKAGVSFRNQLARAVYEEASVELLEVVRRTPLLHGPLRASERLDGPHFEGDNVYVMIVAGGPSAPYAVYVHENEEADHPIGQDHFISSVLEESQSYMGQRILKRMRLNSLEL